MTGTQGVIADEHDRPLVEDRQNSGLALIEKAVELKLDSASIAQLWAVQKDVQETKARLAYEASFAQFKRTAPRLKKTKHVQFNKTDYWHAELDKICDLLIPALGAVGITHRYEIEPKEGMIYVTCVLTHEDGHSQRTTLFGLPDDSGAKNKIQAVGSAVTYLERYTLLAATGLATEGQDNDGAGGHLDDVDGRVKEILKATPETLIKVFKHHHEEATKSQDGVAMLKITNAKDQRREELGI